MKQEYDRTRQMVDLALSAGRKLQSPQTGYVHWCFHKKDETINDTIPLYENFLFALSLLRFKTVDTMKEGQKIIEHLLAFQCKKEGVSYGNFPIYLHEYPRCFDSTKAATILPVFYWIFKEYGAVIGKELSVLLKQATEEALAFSEPLLEKEETPFPVKLKIAALQKVFGELWSNSERKKKGEEALEDLRLQTLEETFGSWFSPQYIGDTLISLQMAYPEGIQPSPWKHFWDYLCLTWDWTTCSYCGPAIQDKQWKKEPMSTLYDLFVGHLAGEYNYRSFRVHPFQLQGALIHGMEEFLPDEELPLKKEGVVSGYRWILSKTKEYAYCTIEKRHRLPPEYEKGFQPFRFIWGDNDRTHTFVCQGGNVSLVDCVPTDDGIDLFLTVQGEVNGDDKEKTREIAFFCDRQEGIDITVRNQKATTFKLGDELHIRGKGVEIGLTLTVEEGNGRFLGHLHPGNRPSQKDRKGESRFRAYDWAIFLRSIARNTDCRFRASLKFRKLPSEPLAPFIEELEVASE